MVYSTKTKNALLKILESQKDGSISAADVLELLKNKGLEVNKTTVYRNLEQLEEDGKVHKFASEDGKGAFYQLSKDSCNEHLHLQCSICGKVEHLDCEFMEIFTKHIQEEHGFALNCTASVIHGVCRECQKKEKH